MGLLPKHLHLMAIDQSRHPLRGEVLTIGQQAVYSTLEEVEAIFKSHGIKTADLDSGQDTRNKIPSWNGTPLDCHTNAQTVLKLLGAGHVYVADLSTYENPDYIIDLNDDVDPKYEDRFDYLLDVGTLEHVYDVPAALRNFVRMLKTGGCITLILPTSNSIDHGFYSFSPTLFYDYFSCNGFDDFSCYLVEGSCYNYLKKGRIFAYTGVEKEYPFFSKRNVEVYFSATKMKKELSVRKPIQSIYANMAEWNQDGDVSSKNRTGEPSSPSSLDKLKRKAWFFKRRVRPEFFDDLRKNKMKNIKYIGKY